VLVLRVPHQRRGPYQRRRGGDRQVVLRGLPHLPVEEKTMTMSSRAVLAVVLILAALAVLTAVLVPWTGGIHLVPVLPF
jgi:hypothetical protein